MHKQARKKKDLHIIEYLTVYHRFYILLQIACNSHKNEKSYTKFSVGTEKAVSPLNKQ